MKKLITAFLSTALLLILSLFSVSALQEGDFTYTISGGNATITGTTKKEGTLTIPTTIGGCKVTVIGNSAFEDCTELTGSLVIPEGITTIHMYAFQGCSGFTGELVLPSTVTSIQSTSFDGCKFKSIKVADSNPNYCSKDGVLFNKSGTTLVKYPAGKSGSYSIPEGVTSFGSNAFSGCSALTGDLGIPSTLTFVNWAVNPFSDCGNSNFKVATEHASYCDIDGVMFNKAGTKLVFYPSGRSGSYTIPDGVKSIDYSAFKNCKGITGDLVIPASLTGFIPNTAFSGCSGIQNFKVLTGNPTYYDINGVLFTNTAASGGLTKITLYRYPLGRSGSYTIPNGVAVINSNAFDGCTGLTGTLVIPDSVEQIAHATFQNCTGLKGTLVLSKNLKKIDGQAFNGCSGLKGKLKIPNGVTSIGNQAFQGCSGFTGDLVIPASVKEIVDSAFYGCAGLTQLVLSEGLKSIGGSAFSGCTGFTGDLVIPKSVVEIGGSAFYNCSGFTGLILSEGVKTIGNQAFMECKGFTGSLVIPDSVTAIGDSAFRYCQGFKNTSLILNGVETIGKEAFYACSGIRGTLVLSRNLTSLGDKALNNSFTDVIFLGNPPSSWGRNAIGGTSATLHYYENTVGWTSPTWKAPDGTTYKTNLVIPRSIGETITSDKLNCQFFTQDPIPKLILGNYDYWTGKPYIEIRHFLAPAYFRFTDRYGNILPKDSVVKTGDKVLLTNQAGNVVFDEADIVVQGDVNSDGYFDVTDILRAGFLIDENEPDLLECLAADFYTSGSGIVIDVFDLIAMIKGLVH